MSNHPFPAWALAIALHGAQEIPYPVCKTTSLTLLDSRRYPKYPAGDH